MYAEKPWLRFYDPTVRHSLDYPVKPLSQLLAEAAQKAPQQAAYSYGGKESTYAELEQLTNRLASSLHLLGVKKGSRVAVMLPNCPQFVISYYAIVRVGAIVVNVNPLYTERELLFQLRDAGAETIITFVEAIPRVSSVREQSPLRNVIVTSLLSPKTDVPEGCLCFNGLSNAASAEVPDADIKAREDVAVLQYTGGTTGVSKGAMLTHYNLVSNAIQLHEWCAGLKFEKILTVLPLFHVYGMTCCMNLALITGSTMVLLPRFEPKEVLEVIRTCRPTFFPGVPTMYTALFNHPEAEQYDLTVVEFYNSGAAPMPLELMGTIQRRLAGKSVYSEGYGLSEASPVTHSNPIHRIKSGSVGVPYPDTECRVVDMETGEEDLPPGQAGELVISGPQVMKGYWNMPVETNKALRNGWLYTGDIAMMDEEGYFYIVDRKKDMIIASGYNVYPREVEETIYELPQVQEAVVVGVPDKYRGETVKAYIVLKAGQGLTAEEIIRFCQEQLAAYKVPKIVEFREELPKSAVGKLLRRLLVEEDKKRLHPEQT
ncbi:MAG: long-chain fatty acid--CoA ligase [Dethiobacter sp.]|nr:long-chain fatty acid--CoA ligase [Dethiobacter sp.]MCL5981152.1 long-chain fatty acid--CoA ligase [Bacillota bacterium]